MPRGSISFACFDFIRWANAFVRVSRIKKKNNLLHVVLHVLVYSDFRDSWQSKKLLVTSYHLELKASLWGLKSSMENSVAFAPMLCLDRSNENLHLAWVVEALYLRHKRFAKKDFKLSEQVFVLTGRLHCRQMSYENLIFFMGFCDDRNNISSSFCWSIAK